MKQNKSKVNEVAVFDGRYGEQIILNGTYCLPCYGDLKTIDHENSLCFSSNNIKETVEYFNLLLESNSEIALSIKQKVLKPFDSVDS